MKPKVKALAHGVIMLDKIAQGYPQSSYAGFGVSIQIYWKYLQMSVPRVGIVMGTIEEALRENFSS